MTVSKFIYCIINLILAVAAICIPLFLIGSTVSFFVAGVVWAGWLYVVLSVITISLVGGAYVDGMDQWKKPRLSENQN